MSRQVTVVTPENIPLTLELAGLGTRFGALLLDALWQLMVGTALLMIAGLLALFASAYMQPLLPFVPALLILGTFVIVFGYFIFFETIWNGQTPGKKAFGLRVVRDGGYPVGFFASAARNFVRIADFLPVFYGVGSISMFFNGEYKRLGDFVAGTIVIKERAAPARAHAVTEVRSRFPAGRASRPCRRPLRGADWQRTYGATPFCRAPLANAAR